jgi:hypothetical protein
MVSFISIEHLSFTWLIHLLLNYSLLLQSCVPLHWYITVLVIHSTVEGHLDYFQTLVIMNKITLNIPVQIFEHRFYIACYSSEIKTNRSGMSGLCAKYMFNIIRNYQTVFQSPCSIFHPYQISKIFLVIYPFCNQCHRLLTFPHPRTSNNGIICMAIFA